MKYIILNWRFMNLVTNPHKQFPVRETRLLYEIRFALTRTDKKIATFSQRDLYHFNFSSLDFLTFLKTLAQIRSIQ